MIYFVLALFCSQAANVAAQFDPTSAGDGSGPALALPSLPAVSPNVNGITSHLQRAAGQYAGQQQAAFNSAAANIFTTAAPVPAGQGGDVFAAVLSGNKQAMAAAGGLPGQDNGEDSYTGRFLDGFVKGYLQKTVLDTGEKTCLRIQMHKFGKHFVRVVEVMLGVVGDFIGHQANTGTELMAGMNAVGEVMTLVRHGQQLGATCLQPDAKAVLEVSAMNTRNATYIRSRMSANGPEIFEDLSKIAPYIESNNYTYAGNDTGKILRKILLSSDSTPKPLVLKPGVTKEMVPTMILEGTIQGIFLAGSNVTITSAADPRVDVFVDLHRCIAKEAKYFAAAIDAIYMAVTQLVTLTTATTPAPGMAPAAPAFGQPGAVDPISGNAMSANPMAFMGKLTGLMGNVPVLMMRCGLTMEQKQMLKIALKNPKAISLAFGIPGETNKTKAALKATTKFQNVTADWEAGNYNRFGNHLGGVIRDILLAAYPQNGTPPPSAAAMMQYQTPGIHRPPNSRYQSGQYPARKLSVADYLFESPAPAVPLAFGIFGAISLLGVILSRAARKRLSHSLLMQVEEDIGFA